MKNAKLVVLNTTAYPFRLPETSMVCVYCCESFEDPGLFRKHMEDDHKMIRLSVVFAHIHEGYLKVDCTDLRCRICGEAFDKIHEAAEHLFTSHSVPLQLEYGLRLQQFNLQKDVFMCSICDRKFPRLRALSRHSQTHFADFTCEECGKSYSTNTSLASHIRHVHRTVGRLCRKCKKTFKTAAEMREHSEHSKYCRQHICHVCGSRFYTWKLKQNHMVDAHNFPKKSYPCPECGHIFPSAESNRKHFKLTHTQDYLVCSCCSKKFEKKYDLKKHMLIHTGEKLHQCTVCSKSFPRKHTLKQHMWIHSEEKKYVCEPCDKKFNQKVSWQAHMKAHHPDSN